MGVLLPRVPWHGSRYRERVPRPTADPKTDVVFGRCKMTSGEDLGKAADQVSAALAMARLDQEGTNNGLVLEKMVPEVGLEPTRRTDPRGILSPVRLPIPPLRHHIFSRDYSHPR